MSQRIQNWNRCKECGAKADVERYDTFYKSVVCRKCGATSYIPKRCATAFDEYKTRIKELQG